MGAVSVACQHSRRASPGLNQEPSSNQRVSPALDSFIGDYADASCRYVVSGAESLVQDVHLLLNDCKTDECSQCSASRSNCEECFRNAPDVIDEPLPVLTDHGRYLVPGTELATCQRSLTKLDIPPTGRHRVPTVHPYMPALGKGESARRKATARIYLQEALASNSAESLQRAISVGEGAGLKSEELKAARAAISGGECAELRPEDLEAARAGLHRWPTRQRAAADVKAASNVLHHQSGRQQLSAEAEEQRLMRAVSHLEQAVRSKDIEMLRAALTESESAGLASRDLDVVRSFIAEHDLKASVQMNLNEAVRSRSPVSLRAAIADGESTWMLGHDLEPARAALAREEQRKVARTILEGAYASGNLERLRIAVMEGEAAGLDGKLFAAARRIVLTEDRRSAARDMLAAAVACREIVRLKNALEEARAAGVKPRELQHAMAVLQFEEQRAQQSENMLKLVTGQTTANSSGGNSSGSQATPPGHSDVLSPISHSESHDGADISPRGVPLESSGEEPNMSVVPNDEILQGVLENNHNPRLKTPPSGSPGAPMSNSPSFSDARVAAQVLPRSEASPRTSVPKEDAVIDELLQWPALSTTPAVPKDQGFGELLGGGSTAGSAPLHAVQNEKFSEYGSLIEALLSRDTVLLKGSWLVQCQRTHGLLPRRQDLPKEATWHAEELLHCLNSSPPAAQIVSISYCWKTVDHPDPHGEQLQLLSRVIEQRLTHEGPSHDLAVFLDWCSLCQPPRTVAEENSFAQALRDVALWYAHQRTAVWLLTTAPQEGSWKNGNPDECSEPYERRGWPTFEWALGSLITPSHELVDLGLHDDRCNDWVAVFQQCKAQRRPPWLPEEFGVELAEKHFARPADRNLLERKYAQAFREVMAFTWNLSFHSVGWGDAEAIVLAQSLPYCGGVTALNLTGNRIGNAGAIALATVIPSCSHLSVLRLQHNQIGEEGKRQLHLAWQQSGKEEDMLGL